MSAPGRPKREYRSAQYKGAPMSFDTLPPPAGFRPVPMGGPFVAGIGPFYVQELADGQRRLGLRLERRHCNTMGHCHGGALATFIDMLMPVAMYDHPQLAGHRRFLPTVSLQVDYIGAAHAGDWLEGEPQVLKITRSVVFAQGLVRANGHLVARCSGVYKIAAAMPPDHPGMYSDLAPELLPTRR